MNSNLRPAILSLPWLLFFTCFLHIFSVSQEPPLQLKPVGDPLPLQFPTINDILQDSRGEIWIGTYTGLIKYNGYDIEQYVNRPGDKFSLYDNKVQAIAEDSQGNIWVGCQSGLSVYKIAEKRFYNFQGRDDHELLNSVVYSLAEDDEKHMWVTSLTGLFEIEIDTFRIINFYPNDSSVSYMNIDHKGNIWYTDNHSVFVRARGKRDFTKVNSRWNVNSIDGIRGLFVDKKRNWIFFSDNGIEIIDPDAERPLVKSLDVPKLVTDYHHVNLERWGKYLLHTTTEGILVFDLDEYTLRIFPIEEPGNYDSRDLPEFYSICRTAQDHMLIGGSYKYLSQFDFRNPRFKRIDDVKLDNTIVAASHLFEIYEYSPRKLLFSQKEGPVLFDIDTNEETPFPHRPLFNPRGWDQGLTSFLEQGDSLWIGTVRGIYLFDKRKEKFLDFNKGLDGVTLYNDVAIRDLLIDRKGRLWIASWTKGAFTIDFAAKKVVAHEFPPTTSYTNNKNCRVLFEDSGDQIWIGTRTGLLCYDEPADTFMAYRHDPNDPESMSENTSFCIYEDSLGYIWSGSYGGGLNRLDPATGKFVFFTTEDGLCGNNAMSLMPDNQNNLWISSFKGLTRFNPYTFSVDKFNAENGLEQELFSAFMRGRLRSGELVFASKLGIVYFHPDSIRKSDFLPPLLFTDFRLFNESVPVSTSAENQFDYFLEKDITYTEELNLKYGHKVFSVRYAAIDYDGPRNIEYAYKLEGFDDDWQFVGNRREATYTNLDPGQYIFKVKATNADKVWNESPAVIAINIAPPWWATWWAYITYVLSAAFIIGLIYRYQRRRWQLQTALKVQEQEAFRLKELDTIKSDLYTNITHEFRTPLTVINGMCDLIKKEPETAISSGLSLIKKNTNQLLAMVNQMLDLQKLEAGKMEINPVLGDVVKLVNYVAEPFEFLALEKGLQFIINHNSEEIVADHDPDKLSAILVNLLSNSIKYTTQGAIGLKTSSTEDRRKFCLEINDTGVGIKKKNIDHIFDRFYQEDATAIRAGEGTGIGLAIVKEFCDLVNAEILVESEEEKGTNFTIYFPWSRSASPAVLDKEINPVLEMQELDQATALIGPGGRNGQGEKLQILIIEDNPDVRYYLTELLHNSYQVITAGDGIEGVEKCTSEIPDLVICDVMMPEKDGYAVCDDLHKEPLTTHIPIILLTAKADQKSKLEGYARGAEVYLTKPFSSDELRAQISMLLAQRKRLQSFYRSNFSGEEDDQVTFDPFLKKLNTLILENLSDPDFKISALAKSMLVSRSQLHKKIKSLTGLSASIYVRKIRLDKSKQLLKNTDLTIAEIAYKSGFNDPNFFSRVFKKEFGETPSKMR